MVSSLSCALNCFGDAVVTHLVRSVYSRSRPIDGYKRLLALSSRVFNVNCAVVGDVVGRLSVLLAT